MSVGFGFSVGDFLAALNLVGTVIDALREASESSAAYRELLAELFALETALLRVKRLDLDDGQRTEKIALRQAAAQCQRTIDQFWNKIKKYQPHLRDGGTGSRIKDSWVKIKWAVCKKDDIERFKADLRGHTGAIEVLLLAVQMEATTIQARRQNKGQKTLAGKIQESSSQWLSKLSSITDGINQSIQQGKTLLDATAKIVQTNLRVFQMIFDIHQYILQVPAQVNRQQPVYMIDAFGRESPFHLEFVRSAEAFIAILKVNFKSSGSQKIERGEFVIEDNGTKRDIDLTSNWETCFSPGQRVSMSIVFKRINHPMIAACPGCSTESGSASDREVTCNKCGLTFRRVTEVSDEMLPPVHPTMGAGRVRSFNRPPIAEPRPLKRNREVEDDDDIQKFRRVRLLGPVNRRKPYSPVKNDWQHGTGFARVHMAEEQNQQHHPPPPQQQQQQGQQQQPQQQPASHIGFSHPMVQAQVRHLTEAFITKNLPRFSGQFGGMPIPEVQLDKFKRNCGAQARNHVFTLMQQGRLGLPVQAQGQTPQSQAQHMAAMQQQQQQ